MSNLGERIKQLRGAQTQRALAELLGIPATTLSNYEQNKSELNFAMIDAITRNFCVSTDWLLFGRGPMRHEEKAESAQKREAAPAPAVLCTHCLALEQKMVKKLESFEEERRELTTELRQLWKENGELREKCARLEERQYQRSGHRDSEPVGHAG